VQPAHASRILFYIAITIFPLQIQGQIYRITPPKCLHLLFHNQDNLPGFFKRIIESDESRMMQYIHDVHLSFKFFFLAGSRFDKFRAESCSSIELHALFYNAKSTSKNEDKEIRNKSSKCCEALFT